MLITLPSARYCVLNHTCSLRERHECWPGVSDIVSHWEILCAQFMPLQFTSKNFLLKPTEHFKTSTTRNMIKLKRLIQLYNSIVCASTSFRGVHSPIISVCQCFGHWKRAAITSGRETNEGHFCTAALSDMSINSQQREEQHRWIFLSQPDKQRDTSEFSLRVESVRQNEMSYCTHNYRKWGVIVWNHSDHESIWKF